MCLSFEKWMINHISNAPSTAWRWRTAGYFIEDDLTLKEGKAHIVDENDPSTAKGIIVPPRMILYKHEERNEEAKQLATNRNEWKRAHLLAVPKGKPEFNVITWPRRSYWRLLLGFAAALAPAAHFELNAHLSFGWRTCGRVALSHVATAINVLEIPVPIAGDFIWESEESHKC